MAVWVVRQDAPKWGGWEKIALEKEVAVIDFGLETDIKRFPTRQALANHLWNHAHDLYGYRSGPPGRLQRQAGQVWRFYYCIAPGDLAVYHIWLDGERLVTIGEFLGGDAYQSTYPEYEEGWRPERPSDPIVFQVRPVNWLATDIPMSAFDPGLHLDAPGTVYQPSYPGAEAHVREVLQKHSTPN